MAETDGKPGACTPNVDGSELVTSGNGACTPVKHSTDNGHTIEKKPDTEVTLGMTYAERSNSWVMEPKANTGKLLPTLSDTFALGEACEATKENPAPYGKEHKVIRSIAGNLYRTTPIDNASVEVAKNSGFHAENVDEPLERTNS